MKKKWPYYLGYIIILITLFLLFLWYIQILKEYGAKNYDYPWQLLFLPLIGSITFGIFLGLENFIGEIKKEGAWRLEKAKLIIVGLPALYMSSFALIYFTLRQLVIFPGFITAIILKYGNTVQICFGILLGHVLISSLYKVEIAGGNTKKIQTP